MSKRTFDSYEEDLYQNHSSSSYHPNQLSSADEIFPPSPPGDVNRDVGSSHSKMSSYSTSASSSELSLSSNLSKISTELQPQSELEVIPISPKKTRNFHIDLSRFLVRGSQLSFTAHETAILYRPYTSIPVKISLSGVISSQDPRIILFFPGMDSDNRTNELPLDVLQVPIVRKLGCIVSSAAYRPISPPISSPTNLPLETGRPSQKVIPELYDERGYLARACRVLDPLGGGCVPIPSIVYIDNRHVKVVIPFQCVRPSQLREIVSQVVELF